MNLIEASRVTLPEDPSAVISVYWGTCSPTETFQLTKNVSFMVMETISYSQRIVWRSTRNTSTGSRSLPSRRRLKITKIENALSVASRELVVSVAISDVGEEWAGKS